MPDESDQAPFDLEALQAQIDLSISITHNLVASWLPDPSSSSRSGSGSGHDAAAQREIDEYQAELQRNLHRPPTLGLGAAIPATSNHATARDVARLKGNLTKGSKKRSRDEYQADGTSPTPAINGNGDEDDEDSRSGAIKSSSAGASTSKTNGIVNGVGKGSSRLSVFEGTGKKKKKKGNNTIHPAVAAAMLAANGNGNDGFVEPAPPSSIPLSNGDAPLTSVMESESILASSQVETQTESQSTLHSMPSQQSSSQIPPSPTSTPAPSIPIPTSRPSSPSQLRRSKSPSKSKSLPSAPPSPSINRVFPNAFDPPPAPPSSIDETPTVTEAETGSDEEEDAAPASMQGEPNGSAGEPDANPKKKRKRRKRKKKGGAMAVNGAGEGGASSSNVVVSNNGGT